MRGDWIKEEKKPGDVQKHTQARDKGVTVTLYEGPLAFGYAFAGPDGKVGCAGACNSLGSAFAAAEGIEWEP